MSSEQLASVDLGLTNYEAMRFHSKAVGEPFVLNRYSGNGITFTTAKIGLVSSTTNNIEDKPSHRIIAINDGTWVTISGSVGRTNGATIAINDWQSIFSITYDNLQAYTASALELLRPHPAVVGYTVDGAGADGDTGVAMNHEFIGGTCFAVTAAATTAVGGGSGASTTGLVRICATSATAFAVEICLAVNTSDPGGAPVDGSIAFHLRYPAAPVTRGNNLA